MNINNTTVCSRCVMDTTDRDIKLIKRMNDYCQNFDQNIKKTLDFKNSKKNYLKPLKN